MIKQVANFCRQIIQSPLRSAFLLGGAVWLIEIYSFIRYPNILGIDPYVRLVNHDYFLVQHWLPGLQFIIKTVVTFEHSGQLLLFLLTIFSALTVVAFYLMCRKLLNDNTVAFFSALVFGSMPIFLILSRMPYLEPLALLFLFLTIYFLESNRFYLASSSYFLACLMREEAWFLLPIFLWRLKDEGFSLNDRRWWVFLFGPAVGILFVLWPLRAPFDPFITTWSNLFPHPLLYFVLQTKEQIISFLSANWALVIAGGLGIIEYVKENRQRRSYIFIFPVLFLIALIFRFTFGLYFPRHLFLAESFLIPFVFYHFSIFSKNYFNYIRTLFVVLFIIFSLLSFLTYLSPSPQSALSIKNAEIIPYKNFGYFLRDTLHSTDRVLSVYRKSTWGESSLFMRSVFYSGYEMEDTYVPLSDDLVYSSNQLQRNLAEIKATYLLTDLISDEAKLFVDTLVSQKIVVPIYTEQTTGLSLYRVER